jgi:hypothetical protein
VPQDSSRRPSDLFRGRFDPLPDLGELIGYHGVSSSGTWIRTLVPSSTGWSGNGADLSPPVVDHEVRGDLNSQVLNLYRGWNEGREA